MSLRRVAKHQPTEKPYDDDCGQRDRQYRDEHREPVPHAIGILRRAPEHLRCRRTACRTRSYLSGAQIGTYVRPSKVRRI